MDKKESRILFKNKFNQLANFSLENLLLPQESIESSLRKEGSWGMVDIAKIPNLDLQLVGFLQDDYDFSGYELDEWGDPADDPDLLREYPFVPGYEYRVEWTKKTQDILDCIKKPASKRYGAKGDFWLMEFWQIVCRRELPELKSSLSITEGEFHLSFDSYNELVIALTAISKAMRDVGDYAPTEALLN